MPQLAAKWAMRDLKECGIDPMAHLALAAALIRIYTALLGETECTSVKSTSPAGRQPQLSAPAIGCPQRGPIGAPASRR